MMDLPLVSVVMAVKNAERYLAEALDSVVRQSFSDYEIVVVDGRSTDDSRRIASSYPGVRVIEQEGPGFAQAWNVGIDASRGAFIAILDSDDTWPAHKLARQVGRFAADSAIGCTIGRVKFVLEPGQPTPAGFKPELLGDSHVAYMPGTSMTRRDVFATFGKFGENWQIASDLAWFAELRESGVKIDIVDEVLLHKRIHDTNLSNIAATAPVYRRELLALARQSLLRQRGTKADWAGEP